VQRVEETVKSECQSIIDWIEVQTLPGYKPELQKQLKKENGN
jgi:hypothetical protein